MKKVNTIPIPQILITRALYAARPVPVTKIPRVVKHLLSNIFTLFIGKSLFFVKPPNLNYRTFLYTVLIKFTIKLFMYTKIGYILSYGIF